MTDVLKILVIDNNALFRQGLCYVLHKLHEQTIILEAANFEQARPLIAENLDLDLVLLELNSPGMDGIAILNAVSRAYPSLPVVILSSYETRRDAQKSLASGAVGYISKASPKDEILNALRQILSGQTYSPPGAEFRF